MNIDLASYCLPYPWRHPVTGFIYQPPREPGNAFNRHASAYDDRIPQASQLTFNKRLTRRYDTRPVIASLCALAHSQRALIRINFCAEEIYGHRDSRLDNK
jgi:hypothetical protein